MKIYNLVRNYEESFLFQPGFRYNCDVQHSIIRRAGQERRRNNCCKCKCQNFLFIHSLHFILQKIVLKPF